MENYCFTTLFSDKNLKMETFSDLLLVKTTVPSNHTIRRLKNNSKHRYCYILIYYNCNTILKFMAVLILPRSKVKPSNIYFVGKPPGAIKPSLLFEKCFSLQVCEDGLMHVEFPNACDSGVS